MKKVLVITVCTWLIGVTSIAAQDTLRVATNAYFQVGCDYPNGNFSLPFSKVGVKGSYGTRWSGYVELRPASGNPLIKAYIDYRLQSFFTIRAGQFTNPFKWIELPPDQRHLPFFAVYEQYVANGDDIGIAALGTISRWTYYLCIINGAGKNVPDNNWAKDMTGYMSYQLPIASAVELCWQSGKQPGFFRSGGFARASGNPLSMWHWEAAYTTRRDLHHQGWYALTVIGPQKIQLTARLHRTVQNDPLVWTVGLQGHPAQNVKWQSAMAISQDRQPQVAAIMQFNF